MSVFDYSKVIYKTEREPVKPYCLLLSDQSLVMTGPMTETEADSLKGQAYFTGGDDPYQTIQDVLDPRAEITVYRGKDGMGMLDGDKVRQDYAIEEKSVKVYEAYAYNEYDAGEDYVLDRSILERRYQSLLDAQGISNDQEFVSDLGDAAQIDSIDDNIEQPDTAPVVELDDTVFGDDGDPENFELRSKESAGVVLSSDIDQNLEPVPEHVVLSNVSVHQVYKTKNPDVVSVVINDSSLEAMKFSMICNKNDVTPHKDASGKPVGWDIDLGLRDKSRNVSIRLSDGYHTVRRTAEEIQCAYENTQRNHADYRAMYMNGIPRDQITPIDGSCLVEVRVPFDASHGDAVFKTNPCYVKPSAANGMYNIKVNANGSVPVIVSKPDETTEMYDILGQDLVSGYQKAKEKDMVRIEASPQEFVIDDQDVMDVDAGFGL